MLTITVSDSSGQQFRLNAGYNLRVLFPSLLERILRESRDKFIPEWMKCFLKEESLTSADYARALCDYSHFMEAALNTPPEGGIQAALESTGFQSHPEMARLLVYARIGQILTASFWSTFLDGTRSDEVPPDVMRISALAEHLEMTLGSQR